MIQLGSGGFGETSTDLAGGSGEACAADLFGETAAVGLSGAMVAVVNSGEAVPEGISDAEAPAAFSECTGPAVISCGACSRHSSSVVRAFCRQARRRTASFAGLEQIESELRAD